MRTIARLVLSIDQRLYDILAIVLIGTASNVIVGGAGKDDEYELLVLGLVCVVSGGITMFLRSRRAAIETSVDAKRLLNKQAVSTKAALLATGSPVPEDVESRASAAANTRRKDIRDEIDIAIAMNTDVVLVLTAFVAGAFMAYMSISGIVTRLYVPTNGMIEEIIKNTASANHERVVDDIRRLREEVVSLSAVFSSNDTRTVQSIAAGQLQVSRELDALRADLIVLSACVSNLPHQAIPPADAKGDGED